MRFFSATIALICLPAIIGAQSDLYVRDAEALANPYAYAEADAWAEAEAYAQADPESDLYTRDADAFTEPDEHFSLYARYADPSAMVDADFFPVYARDALPFPMPAKEMTQEQKNAERARARRGTIEYHRMDTAWRALYTRYQSERNLGRQIELAVQLANGARQ